MVLGRKTYDHMAGYWPTAPDGAGGTAYNEATKYVASRGRPTLEWSHSVLIWWVRPPRVASLKG